MKDNSDKTEEQVECFLRTEESEARPRFEDAKLAREILMHNKVDGPKRTLLRFVPFAIAACLLIAFLFNFQMPNDSPEDVAQVQFPEPLLDSDKELLEDLLVMPQEMNWGEALPDESTLDLLVLLDQPLE